MELPPLAINKPNNSLQFVQLLPVELLTPCQLIPFKGNTWGDLYKYTLALQHEHKQCVLTHQALINAIELEKAKATNNQQYNK